MQSSPIGPIAPSAPSAGVTNPNTLLYGVTGTGTTTTVAPTAATTSTTVTATQAHTALVAIGLELAFVIGATMVAGISPSWADGALAIMLVLLALRGLANYDVFASWASGISFNPGSS